MKFRFIYIILPLAILSMLLGVYAGWLRLGWNFVIIEETATAQHGALMVGSFLGTLIAVERVATLKNKWVWIVPVMFISSLPLMLHVAAKAGYLALFLGSLGYLGLAIYSYEKYRFRGDFLMLIGAFWQALGHLALWLTYSYPMAFAAWMAFFVFTIIGERLNLTRFLPVDKKAHVELYGWLGMFVISMFLYHKGYGIVLTISLVGLAQWLIRHDIVRHNITKTGIYKFLGVTLLLGYIWLMLTGVVAAINSTSPWLYDAVLHSFFIGFVLAMIMAHAPIIFPSLLGINTKPFHRILYLWVIGMQASLVVRIAGDLLQNIAWRQWGGLLNGIMFIGYLATVIVLIIKGSKTPTKKYKNLVQY